MKDRIIIVILALALGGMFVWYWTHPRIVTQPPPITTTPWQTHKPDSVKQEKDVKKWLDEVESALKKKKKEVELPEISIKKPVSGMEWNTAIGWQLVLDTKKSREWVEQVKAKKHYEMIISIDEETDTLTFEQFRKLIFPSFDHIEEGPALGPDEVPLYQQLTTYNTFQWREPLGNAGKDSIDIKSEVLTMASCVPDSTSNRVTFDQSKFNFVLRKEVDRQIKRGNNWKSTALTVGSVTVGVAVGVVFEKWLEKEFKK